MVNQELVVRASPLWDGSMDSGDKWVRLFSGLCRLADPRGRTKGQKVILGEIPRGWTGGNAQEAGPEVWGTMSMERSNMCVSLAVETNLNTASARHCIAQTPRLTVCLVSNYEPLYWHESHMIDFCFPLSEWYMLAILFCIFILA